MPTLKANLTPLGRRVHATLAALEESERWSAERIGRYQAEQLARLLVHAYATVPFHRARLEASGYQPGMAVTPEFWRSLPVLQRRDLQEQGEGLRSAALPPGHGESFKISSSGTTAMPVSVWRSQRQAVLLEAVVLRKLLWHGFDIRAKIGAILRDREGLATAPAGRHHVDWGTPSALVFETGPAVVLNIRSTVAEIAAWLTREAPAYLRIPPTLLRELSFYFLDRGIALPALRGIMSSAEVISPDLRALVRRVFGLGIFASYGANEVGTIALQCPTHEHYHVQAEATLVEVVDDAGRPCAPGKVGAVLLTPLHGYASPLIRYAIGDRAEVGEPCPCGRPHPVLRQIVGRTRDQIVLPSGQRHYCHHDALAFWEFSDIRQFQVVQKTHHDLELHLVVRRPLTPELEADVAKRLRSVTSEHFRVTLSYHDAMPLTASGKFFEWVCEVDAPPPPALEST